jgi:hypothetical protein
MLWIHNNPSRRPSLAATARRSLPPPVAHYRCPSLAAVAHRSLLPPLPPTALPSRPDK